MANDVTVRVRVKDQLSGELGGIASTVGSLLGGAVIPLTGAVAALGVELAGAGAAAGAFGAAVQPQIANVKQVSSEQDAYNKAVSEYGENSKQALAAQEKLKTDMSQLTPATRQTATAFIDLKTKFAAWSDSLSGDTMPVFTHLLNGLKNTFPLLTPLVKDASAQFLDLSKRFEAFSKTDRFKELVKDFSAFAGGALHDVLSFMERLGKATAGFVSSAGFKDFIEQGRRNLPGVAEALRNVAEFVGKFIKAAGPLGGLQLKVFEILAETLNAIPMDVLQILVPMLLGAAAAMKLVKLAMMGFEIIKGIVLGFQLLTGATLELDAAMDANPVGAVVLAVMALGAALIYAYNHVGWFHDAVVAVWSWIKDHWKLVLGFLTGPIGAAVVIIASHWGKIKSGLSSVVNWIKSNWRSVVSVLTSPISAAVSFITTHWGKIKSGAQSAVSAIRSAWSTVRGILTSPFTSAWGTISGIISRISSFISSLPGRVAGAVSSAAGKLTSALNPSNWFAHGGTVGAAETGGNRSGMVMVGEAGPELVRLPTGSHVMSNPDTRRALGAGGGGGVTALQIEWVGGAGGDDFIAWLRKNIRIKGGNVQSVLGQN